MDELSNPTRRAAIMSLGAAGLAIVLAGCRDDRATSAPPTTTGAPRSTTTDATTTTVAGGGATTSTTLAPDCVLAPEMTEGPYYLDLNLVRSDIAEGGPGTPLSLAITVVDADRCAPIANATVDVWHADASGEYSGLDGASTTFCRGTQQTDSAGLCHFETVYPGWYQGRAVHIHVKVHVGGNVVHTGQLFFPDSLNAEVATRPPYSDRGRPDTTDATDSIYADGGAQSTLSPTVQGDGFTAAVTLGVQGGGSAAGLA